MKHISIITLILLVLAIEGRSQDADLYVKPPNTNFILPNIHKEMTFEEFQLLSRDVRMKDMAFAFVVPGYVHFRAKEPEWGYSLLGARVLGYTGLGIVAADPDYKIREVLNWDIDILKDEANSKKTTYQWILGTSAVLIAGSYITDIINGHVQLVNKQERIRYKYSLDMLKAEGEGKEAFLPGLKLQIGF